MNISLHSKHIASVVKLQLLKATCCVLCGTGIHAPGYIVACLQSTELSAGMDAIMDHGGITALLVLLNNGHLEAWSSATHTLHMLCSSTPAAAVMITQSGMPYCRLEVQLDLLGSVGIPVDTQWIACGLRWCDIFLPQNPCCFTQRLCFACCKLSSTGTTWASLHAIVLSQQKQSSQ